MQFTRYVLLISVLCWTVVAGADEPIKVVVWDEQQPAQKQAYPNFLGNYIADYLKRQPGLQVHSVSIDHPQKGLSDEVFDDCDVLIWWGHVRNRDITEADARVVVDRLKKGKLSLLALHSAHWATPFVLAMQERAASDALAKLPEAERKKAKIEILGEIVRRPPKRDAELTPTATFEKQGDGTTLIKITRPNCCFPAYKNHGKQSKLQTLLPDHPIAAGIPKTLTLPHTEMYDEPFHVPEPDEVVFEETWEEGHRFRSGMIWKVGEGRVCYFRPGHETHAVYTEKLPMKIVENAVRWLGTKGHTPAKLEVGKPIALFDGKTLNGWTMQDGKPVTQGWVVQDGAIHRGSRAGNIFYEHEVGDFELTFQWKIEKGGNNGLKYRVRKYGGQVLGCEYQILGETKPSFSKGSTGSIYALYEPNEKKKLNPLDEWNSSKIVVQGPRIEHWLNGQKIVEADLASQEWRKRLAQSKFGRHKDFARNSIGRIMLTEHGSKVWYRDLVLTPLPTEEIPPLASEPPPNVVVFLTDDQGTLDVNCYGSEDLFTPNMDRIAQEGVRFTQAYAHTVCCPARALLMTGRHPQRSNVNHWTQGDLKSTPGRNMNLQEVTLAEALKSAGYRTALFGKWHLGAAATHGPTKQGFDEFFGLRGGFIDNYNHYFLHGKGFHDLYRGTEEQFEKGKYFPDLVVRKANRFLEENRDSPFFMYVPFNIPHYPEQADAKFDDRYRDMPMPRQSYARMISTTDDRMGQIMSKLDKLGLRDNTIIVFMSDNGHSAEHNEIRVDDHNSGLAKGTYYGANGGGGNTGKWRGHKGTFFEGGLRVPAVISFPPSIPKGKVRDQAITAADFYPTILDLCNVPLPERKLDGASLLPIIESPKTPTHHKVMHWQWHKSWAVREGDWKLISTGNNLFLGNLADEQPEEKDYVKEKEEVVDRLKSLHDEWAKDVSTPDATAYKISPPSEKLAKEYKLDKSFYKKCSAVQDVLIATSDRVSDVAIEEAAYQFDMIMNSINTEVAQRIRDRKVLCLLIGHDEFTSDLPQFVTDKTGKELDFYNWRQRGFLTHKEGRPTVVFAAEDVLEYQGGMQLESILIHEFGHVIHGAGFDKPLQERLTDTFQRARAKGIWMDGRAAQRFRRVKSETPVSLFDALVKSFPDQPSELIKKCLGGSDILVNGKPTNSKVKVTKKDKVLIVFGGPKECYAHKNRAEYWAEGVQCWYDTNRTMDHDHNHIHTREQLKAYDPQLAQLCRDVLGDSPWRFVSPRQRAGTGHLARFDPSKSPVVVDPEHIENAAYDYYDKYWKDYWQRLRDKHLAESKSP